jgi:hypothetical protein
MAVQIWLFGGLLGLNMAFLDQKMAKIGSSDKVRDENSTKRNMGPWKRKTGRARWAQLQMKQSVVDVNDMQ